MRRRQFLTASTLLTAVPCMAAARPTRGISDTEIRIGASAVLSGPLGIHTQTLVEGARLYFDAVNAAGGVHGRRIVYRVVDDRFDIEQAKVNTRRLIDDDGIFLIYNNTGTAHTAAILPIAAESKTIVFGPMTGAAALRQKYNRYLFHVRASYANEARRMALHLQVIGVKRVAAFYQDDAFGQSLLGEVKKAVDLAGLDLVAQVVLDPKKPDFVACADALAKAEPSAVLMCTAGETFSNLVKALQATPARPTLYGFSVNGNAQLMRDLGPAAHGIVLAQIMPSLGNKANPAVYEYLSLVARRGGLTVASPAMFEGFMHARILVEGLRRAGRDLSTETLVTTLETSGEITFGKFSAHYSSSSHTGSSYVELAMISGDGRLLY